MKVVRVMFVMIALVEKDVKFVMIWASIHTKMVNCTVLLKNVLIKR